MFENLRVRLTSPEEYRATEELTREAFWNVYAPGACEHYILHQMRNDRAFDPDLDLVMELDGELIGNLVFIPSYLRLRREDGLTESRAQGMLMLPTLTLGPICIRRDMQRKGYGRIFLNAALKRAQEADEGAYQAVLLTGNRDFYGPSGFIPAKDAGIVYLDQEGHAKEAPYLMVRPLGADGLSSLSGCYQDPAVYFPKRDEIERFDRSFPPKRKI